MTTGPGNDGKSARQSGLGFQAGPLATADEAKAPLSLPVDDALALYLQELGREPLLSAEEEVVLARTIEAGQAAAQRLTAGRFTRAEKQQLQQAQQAGQAACARLVRANTRLVVSIAKKYRGRGLPFLDLIQEGNLGLLRAVERFDYHLGNRFSTYATWWIRQGMTRALSNHSRLIRLPAHLAEPLRSLALAAQELAQATGREPSPEELAAYLDMTLERVHRLLLLRRRPLSLELPVGDDLDAELVDFIEDGHTLAPEDVLADAELTEELDQALEQLTPRQAIILRLRYGLRDGRAHTLVEIGDMFGLSRERIRQLQKKALATLLGSQAAERLRHFRRR